MKLAHGKRAVTTDKLGARAVVIGASMGGLFAARVLADFYGEVLVLDRDHLPDGERNRRGVPQGRHLHALLSRGASEAEALFPGLLAELVDRGVPVMTDYSEFVGWFGGFRVYPGPGPRPDVFFQASRACLEARVRDRVLSLPNVTLIDGSTAVALRATVDRRRVTGIQVDGQIGNVDADLVVDCTGRTGRTPIWLTELGYEPPPEDRVPVDVRYVSQMIRPRPGALDGLKVVFRSASAGEPRGMGMCAVEDDRWLVTAIGYTGHHPPTDCDGFLSFLATVAPAEVIAAIRSAEPLGDIVTSRYPMTLRRRYEKLRRFPEGLLVLGDAMCSFNPVYGQGMTVAALQAQALQDCLNCGTGGLARRYFRAAARPVDVAWKLTVAADMDLEEVRRGQPMPWSLKLVNGYLHRLQFAGTHDKAVTDAIVRVITLMDPPARLFRPNLLRVAVSRRQRGSRDHRHATTHPATEPATAIGTD